MADPESHALLRSRGIWENAKLWGWNRSGVAWGRVDEGMEEFGALMGLPCVLIVVAITGGCIYKIS